MTRRAYRHSFNSGVLDPLLLSRSDIEQYRTGLKQGKNVVLIPQGGCKRRPGLKYLASLGETARLAQFRFNLEQQYLIAMRASYFDVFQAGAKITQVGSPYSAAQVAELRWDQTADTMVLTHEDVVPHLLVRLAASNDPIVTDGSTTTVTVKVPSHGLEDGDKVGLSGVSGAVGGVAVAELNTSHTVTAVDGSLGADPVTTTAGSQAVTVAITGHPFTTGEKVTFSGLTSTGANLAGQGAVPAVELNRTQTIASTTTNSVTFNVVTAAAANDTGGGSAGTWRSPDKFSVTVSTTSTSAASGGGSSVRCWKLVSMSPDRTYGPKLSNIPQFDFQDASSPAKANEVQVITFTNFANGDRYRLELDGQITAKIPYDSSDPAINAQQMQDELRRLSNTSATGITVEYLDSTSPEEYEITFGGTDGLKDWPIITYNVTESTNGLLDVEETTAGGSQEEDVISSTRGWPKACAFFQSRLWFGGLKSRPATVLGSQINDYFNFDIGDALASEAIDHTGQFDPILHLHAGRKLSLLTSEAEVAMSPQGSEGLVPNGLDLNADTNVGTTDVRPIVIGGRPLFVDRTNRSLRQLVYELETDQTNAQEVSILSQQLISTPVDMAVVRNSDGDYGYVVMADGTISVLNVNIDQGVLGWTGPITTDGSFKSVAEVDDYMHAVVQRTIDGSTVYYLERFDPDFYTDSGYAATASATSSWSGLDHLEGETVDVRGEIDAAAGYATLDADTVASGAITTSVAGFATDVTGIEVGIPFDTIVQPMPVEQGRKVRLVSATVDVVDSRDVRVDGWRVVDREGAAILVNPPALLSGLKRVPLRGWSERPAPTITQDEPQPLTVRGMDIEVK